jgi:hypothetical protein
MLATLWLAKGAGPLVLEVGFRSEGRNVGTVPPPPPAQAHLPEGGLKPQVVGKITYSVFHAIWCAVKQSNGYG